jgi:hypothetical protein
MLRFCTALRGHRLLDPKCTELMFQPTRARTAEEAKPRHFGIAGGGNGVGAIFKMYLDLDYASVILSNYDPDAMKTIDKKVEGMILRMHRRTRRNC